MNNTDMVKVTIGKRAGKFGRLTVGCSATLFDSTKKRMLLARRANSGTWCVPGGYMEAGESVTEACVREVLEETGLRVQVKRLVGVYTSPHVLLEYPDGNKWQIVVLHFEAEILAGELVPSEETTEFGFFSQSESLALPMNILDRKRVSDGFAQNATTLICEDFSHTA